MQTLMRRFLLSLLDFFVTIHSSIEGETVVCNLDVKRNNILLLLWTASVTIQMKYFNYMEGRRQFSLKLNFAKSVFVFFQLFL